MQIAPPVSRSAPTAGLWKVHFVGYPASMIESVCAQAIELILSATFSTRGDDGLEAKFMFGPPGAPSWNRNMGTDIFFRRRALVRAALNVRQRGPAYLRCMSIGSIQNMLTHFITEN